MGEQALDLRSGLGILRRHRRTIAGVTLLGGVLGGFLTVVRPPMYTSTTEVLLPTRVTTSTPQSSTTDTQVRIASSQTVLGPAGHRAAPGLSFAQLSRRVAVTAPSEQTVAFAASAPTAKGARALASALAAAELAYVAKADAEQGDSRIQALLQQLSRDIEVARREVATAPSHSSAQVASLSAEIASVSGQIQSLTATAQPVSGAASVIQPASAASRPGVLRAQALPVIGGMVGGLLLSCAATLLLTRRDRRLRTRDQLAAAVGSPVLASFSGRGARSSGGWQQLLSTYDPSPIDAWALRQLLRQLPPGPEGRRRITLLSPAGDARGLALGPLLASYAAHTGMVTELVFGDVSANVNLGAVLQRAAGKELRAGLRVSKEAALTEAALTVVVTTAGAHELGPLAGAAVVAVSAGAATLEGLAQTALAGENAGARVIGVAVVDPDSDDRTSGRLFGRGGDESLGPDLPTRLPGLAGAELRRTTRR